MENNEPIASQNKPYAVDIEAGKKYFWCACGRSKKQPFCDGSHYGTGIQPVRIASEENKKVYLCGCRKSGNKPYCDGSHNKISE